MVEEVQLPSDVIDCVEIFPQLPAMPAPDYATIALRSIVRVGHYWTVGVNGVPSLTTERAACFDLSIAPDRPLGTYRSNGEPAFTPEI